MLKKFNNFAVESISNMQQNLFENQIDLARVFNRLKYDKSLVSNELRILLQGMEIKISEMGYDSKRNMFRLVSLVDNFKKFNGVEKIGEKYYIKFDNDCLFEINNKLIIEYRLMMQPRVFVGN